MICRDTNALLKSGWDTSAKRDESFTQLRNTALIQFILGLLDIALGLIWFIFVFCTCYRVRISTTRVKEESNGFFQRDHLLYVFIYL